MILNIFIFISFFFFIYLNLVEIIYFDNYISSGWSYENENINNDMYNTLYIVEVDNKLYYD